MPKPPKELVVLVAVPKVVVDAVPNVVVLPPPKAVVEVALPNVPDDVAAANAGVLVVGAPNRLVPDGFSTPNAGKAAALLILPNKLELGEVPPKTLP